jgi:hypothetical protein
LGRHGIVFTGGQPGTCTVFLDNLRLRHADGSTSPIWTGDKDTRAKKIADSALFKNVQVRAVPASSVPKK